MRGTKELYTHILVSLLLSVCLKRPGKDGHHSICNKENIETLFTPWTAMLEVYVTTQTTLPRTVSPQNSPYKTSIDKTGCIIYTLVGKAQITSWAE